MEKVAFDSHSLTSHHHNHNENIESEKQEPLLANNEEEQTKEPIYRTLTYDNDENNNGNILIEGDQLINSNNTNNLYMSGEDSDMDELTLKNVLSSKGQFASYLHARNICIY